MSKKLICVIVFGAMVLGQTALGYDVASDPALIAWWECDEGAGTTVSDSSGNGHDGTFVNGDPAWVAGIRGSAVELAGPTLVEVPALNVTLDEATMAGWMLPYGSQPDWSSFIMMRGTATGFNILGFQLAYHWNDTSTSWSYRGGDMIADNEWTFAAVTVTPTEATFYVNGVAGSTNSITHAPANWNANVYLGGDGNANWVARRMNGALDDVSMFSRALSADEILVVMKGLADPALAGAPSPAGDATDVPRDVTLSWEAGKYAVKHDVYLGTSFDDVNNADPSVLVSAGQTGTEYTPDAVFEYGQTYYWRVDEVNGPPTNTVFAGKTWAFTVEPVGYPIANVTATASSSHQATMGPEKTIDGSGLNAMDEHGVTATDMWLSGMGDPTPSIQYEFDKVYKLHELWVWNSNQIIESFIGLGAKDVVVEYSTDGAEWTVVEGVSVLNQATGGSDYTANTIIDFAGAMAKFVKITISSGYGMMPQYGLSEVRFYFIPTSAREPQPADGAVTEGANVMLSWRAGREAVSHEVYLGTDAADLPRAATTNETTYAANGLAYDTTYYWRIDEVNDNEAVSTYAGDVWSFVTPPYGTIDSFEGYDDACNRIFFSWEDGLGHTGGEEIEDCDVPPSNGNGGGSIVGNDVAPFAERTIVNSGGQSMPFSYDNGFGPSEATLDIAGEDWTASGIQTLSLAFSGTEGNTGTLYVKINNTKITYDQNPSDIAVSSWQAWNIDLTAVGGLQNVTSLTIGVDGGSASGMLYIDDIRLYPIAGELITPSDPGAANLAGAWNFNEGSGASAADASGNGNAAMIEGNAAGAWAAGQQGSALSAGNGVYVSVPAAAWSSVGAEFTVSFWALGNDILGNNWGFYAGDATGRLAACHIPWGNQIIFDSTADWASERVIKDATSDEIIGQWRHWTFSRNADTGEKKIYLDGRLYASGSASATPIEGVDRFFIGAGDNGVDGYIGLIDEFQLYNRALTDGEILWLAGGTAPIHKPL